MKDYNMTYEKEEMLGIKEKKWVIVFVDEKEEYHREEVLNLNGSLEYYGDVLVFDTKEEAEEFMENLDSREFERYTKEVDLKEIEDREND